ncbi:PaaI family thioesterase [Planococcus sp. CAU13]|uniref:PaaI family thioesterase n=1 Tax=Planococcus sp. CAU13 TaxID=1541197 RepID=UPI000AF2BE89|nr:PaaI family thioesterase [Planococcus sp. CAU13]
MVVDWMTTGNAEASLEEVKKRFIDSPFFTNMGFEILEFSEEKVLLKLNIKGEFMNVNGTLHGGIHASMLDQVFGMAVQAATKARCATINLNVNYLASSGTGDIYATARILQQGYRNIILEGEVFEEGGKKLVQGTGTFKVFRS